MPEVESVNNFECRRCLTPKPISDFSKDSTRKTGHHPYCKSCQKIIHKNCISVEENRARASAWSKNNKDKRVAIRKRWYAKNPELIRIYKHGRRLKVKSVNDGSVTKESLAKLPKDNCAICSIDLDWKTKGAVHLDHIIPLVLGGLHSISNVQWTCAKCNLSKGGRLNV